MFVRMVVVFAIAVLGACGEKSSAPACELDAALDGAGPMELRFQNHDDPWGEGCTSIFATTGLFVGTPMPSHCTALVEPVFAACSVSAHYECPNLADGGHVEVEVYMVGGEESESAEGFARLRWFDAGGAFVCSAAYDATLDRR